jgi:GTP diphosphokinase / guanosine-3',5'-bis(diphosphate) 3'-diphosphatase
MIRFEEIAETVQLHHPGADLDVLRRAYVFSAVAHKGQVRASGEPYLSHPLEVASILASWRLDPTCVAVGLLHDALEDTLATPQEIEDKFGPVVLHIVEGLTKISQISFSSVEERQAESFRKLLLAMVDDVRVILVKLADRLHNMRTLQHLSEEKRIRISEETMEIYAALAGRLGMSRIKNELEDLAFQHLEPEAYKELTKRVEARRADAVALISRMSATIQELIGKAHIEARIDGRVKRLFSIHQKLIRQKIDLDELYDFIALRVVVKTVSDCYAVLGLLHHSFKPAPGRIKDLIAIPRPNGYRSLHTTLVGDHGMPFEVQIRTEEMHRIAEEGIAAHWKYKEGGQQTLSKDDETFAWLRQLLEDVQDPKEFLSSLKLDLYPEEVYCFTPKGAVRTLPRGATPIDFAYAIHTEVGRRCVGARVGGRIVPLRTKLKNGDIVEILTAPGHHPSRDWLNFAVTSRARSRIKHDLHLAERQQAKDLGRRLLEREWKKSPLRAKTIEDEATRIETLGREIGVGSRFDDVISSIGFGRIDAASFIDKLVPPELRGKVEAPIRPNRAVTPGDARISVQGVDHLLVYRARCCSPILGDPITGYITRGQGVSVHAENCPNIKNAVVDAQRRVPVSWDPTPGETYPVRLSVEVHDRPGLLAAMTTAVSDKGGDIRRAEARTYDDRPGVVDLVVRVRDLDHLKSLVRSVKDISGVARVERTSLADSSQ